MENDYISRHEHDEFRRRIEAENERQNKRIELLEETTRQIGDLTISVEKMAMSMEAMVAEQAKQGERLELLEKEPAKKWKDSTRALFNAFLGAIGAGVAGVVIYLLSIAMR